MAHKHDSFASGRTIAVLVLALAVGVGAGCNEEPLGDPCAPDVDATRGCVDALLGLSGIAGLSDATGTWELTPVTPSVSAYYGAVYVTNNGSSAIDVELEALDSAGVIVTTFGPVNAGKNKWVAYGEVVPTSVAVSVNVDDSDPDYELSFDPLDNFDPLAGSTVSLECQSGTHEVEILPVKFDGTTSVYRTYVHAVTVDGEPTIYVDNNNAERMQLWGWAPSSTSGHDATTCTDERNYDAGWTELAVVDASTTTPVAVSLGTALAVGVSHLNASAPVDALSTAFIEVGDSTLSTVRFERAADDATACGTNDANIPVAVPFVAARAASTNSQACGEVTFKNCTDANVTLTATDGGVTTDYCLVPRGEVPTTECPLADEQTIELDGGSQKVWQWVSSDDPTVIVKKNNGCGG
ncbi:hypothetical protein DB30_06027 [Enhygromyxa salina]|uniref:Uncharacterized protein n=1 Tax=Enhygromyxa salina TaxID=215803 RepID=A0A0C1ZBM0_9BACT|nr:hypothetical protein [Enhygromyxa salina]KIG15119.1 hypothetical protein DB30_06027 [Enhygromyxa salina]